MITDRTNAEIYLFLYRDDSPLPRRKRVFACARFYARSTGVEAPRFAYARASFGKPYFSNCEAIRFSITHSGDFWAAAFGHTELGLDLQRIRPLRAQKLARRFFHPEETAFLERAPERFFQVWTAKESYVKYTGRGIGANFKTFSVVQGGRLTDSIGDVEIRHIPVGEEYSMCICAKDIGSIRLYGPDAEQTLNAGPGNFLERSVLRFHFGA